MRVVFDQQCFQDQATGGISRYIVELARGLAAISQNVTVFAGLSRYPRLRAELGGGVHVVGGIPAAPRSRSGRKIISLFNRAWFSSWSRTHHADIYHASYYRVLPRPRGAKRVLTVFDFIHERFPEVARSDPHLISLKARAVKLADATLCISHATRDDLVRFLPVAQACSHVVYLGCALPPPAPVAVDRPYLLYVGTRRAYKNFSVLAAAFAQSVELRVRYDLVCVGGEPELAEPLPSVRYRRVMASDAELAGLYAGAAAFVYPSRYEGFGLPVIEAMSCGCPVITTRGGSLPEVAGEAALYFDPDSPDDLIRAVERLSSDAELRRRLIQRGHERTTGFTWRRCAEETFEVYRAAIDSAPR